MLSMLESPQQLKTYSQVHPASTLHTLQGSHHDAFQEALPAGDGAALRPC